MAIGIVLAVRLTTGFQQVGCPGFKRQTALHLYADVSELPITDRVPEIRLIYLPCGLPHPERSGLPSEVRGAGAERFGLPSGRRGMPVVG
jgi:hypothetical protein